jgi:hypothetical protein
MPAAIRTGSFSLFFFVLFLGKRGGGKKGKLELLEDSQLSGLPKY